MIDGYLPLARVRTAIAPGRIQVTLAGDGLASLRMPAALKILPTAEERIYSAKELAICPEIQVERIVLRQHRRAELRLLEPAPLISKGAALLAHRSAIPIAEIFADIKYLPVHDQNGYCGQVADLLDQAEQQCLMIRLEDGREILVPYTDAWVEVKKDRLVVEELELFIP
ncbi:MAG: PRC-barrel domain-containing protein [Spirochaetales bacterium]|nr:PRC-barrel domain-containing protein [Spirochaetales bacterium]